MIKNFIFLRMLSFGFSFLYFLLKSIANFSNIFLKDENKKTLKDHTEIVLNME
jgi:hypothetical protein